MMNSNKESEYVMTTWLPQIDLDKCEGCAECVAVCPTGALGIEAQQAALIAPQQCSYCATCEDICPTGAIELLYLIRFKNSHKEN